MKKCMRFWTSLMAAALCLGAGIANGGIYDAWSKQVSMRFATPLQGAVSNFPVLIRLDPGAILGFDYDDFASPANGADLRFTDKTGATSLNYEIEKWNPDGVSSVWVQVPGIASTNDGIKAWWGRSGAAALPCTTNGAVWGSTHLGVWHMNGSADDATIRRNHGVNYGTTTADGITAGGRSFSGSSYIGMPANLRNLGATNAFAITFWFKSASAASAMQCLMEDGTAHDYDSIYLFANAGANQLAAHLRNASGTGVQLDAIAVPTIGTSWHAMAHVYDGATVRTYLDGVQRWSAAISGGINSGNRTLQVGRRPDGLNLFSGTMDELRIEQVSRPADWIHACWISQKPDSTFVAFGEVTGVGAPSIAFVSAYATAPGSALLTGSLTSTGMAETVVGVAYGTTDGGEVMGAWDVTSTLDAGPFTVFPTACTTTVSVASGETYYCRFWASNSLGVAWSYQVGKWMAGEVWVAGAGASADEGGSPAVITLGRPGWATNSALQVSYSMSGTAQNGTDYTALNGLATFAVGATNATVSISAVNDLKHEGAETATLTLNGGAYALGTPSQATVAINDAQKTRFVAKFGSNTSPYDTWAKAATTIQPAVTAAAIGDLILVSNGVYTAAGTGYIVTVDKAVTLQSLNGPAVTTIDPLVGTTSTDRRCLSVTVAGALVSGFTLQGLYYQNSPTTICAVNLSAGTVTNCVIRNNRTIGGVGGAAVSGTGRLVDCVVTNNLCTEWQNGRGGGIFLSSASAVVERCVISGNESQTRFGGGGVYLTLGTLRNCVIAGNRATYYNLVYDPTSFIGKGAGVSMAGGRVENCTVSGNTALERGAGIYMTGGSVSNSIIWANSTSERVTAAERDFYSTSGVKGRNCHPLATGAGNVAGDPQFTHAAGGNFTLLPASPCLDAAATLGTFANDRNGTARPIGAAWDMGAYEMPLSANRPFTCNFTASIREGFSGLTPTFTAYVAGANTTITSYRWQFGDGDVSQGASLQTVSHTYTTGWFTVTLTVSNALGEVASLTKGDYVKAHPPVLYVEKSGSHTLPFNTPAKAATDIKSAVQAAVAGATVMVGNGTWAMTQQVAVEKAIRVRSANGPTNCTTTVPGQIRSFFLWHPGAVLDGLTLTSSGTGDHLMNGAGVYMLQGTVTNCIFRNIVIGGQGGGVWMAGGTVSDCIIVTNRAYEHSYSYGAGVYIAAQAFYGPALVENSRIMFNRCESMRGGGGVYMYRGTIRNCLIAANRCTISNATEVGIGGGLRMDGGLMENCTVVSNFSISSGGGAYVTGSSAVTNTIIYQNRVVIAASGERNLYKSGGTVGYSCIDPAPIGTGNTALDPLFENIGALNFRLKPASPCVDKGQNATWMTGAVDLNRAVRRQNGTVDMGCYESLDPWSGPLIAGFSASPSSGFVSQQVVFTAEPVGLDTNIVWYSWTFGDGHSVAGAGRPVVTNTYAAGYYDVRLILQNQGGEVVTNSRLGYIKIAPAVAYVSLNGTAVAPYTTWGTAAHTLQDALTVVGHGDAGAHTIVAVTSGVYSVGAEIALSSLNTIMGVGPVSNVVVQGVSFSSRVFNLSSSAATLSGLTIRGGYNAWHLYDGGGIYMTAGLVTNCIIRNNMAGGFGGGVYQRGGLITQCAFYENFASEHSYGCGGGLYTLGGLAVDCVFDKNRSFGGGGGGVYVSGGTVRNCLLTRNYADRDYVNGQGGGACVAAGLLESCTVATNWAIMNGGGIYQTGGMVSNTIVADNYVTVSGATNWHNPMASVGYCLSPDLPANPAKGNIAGRPVFENAAAGNYRLARNSPGLDKGRNQAWMAGARDLAGSPRVWLSRWPRVAPQDTVDMGCYELILPPQGTMMILR
jgi:hypothetical protein